MNARKEIVCLVLLMLAAVSIRAFFLSRVEMVGSDEARYIRTAEDLAHGEPPTTIDAPYRPQPLFAYLFASVVRAGKEPIAACQWLSLLLGVLTLIPFHFCVRSFCSSSAALWSDCIYTLAPFSIQYSLWAMPHAIFNLLCVMILFFVLKVQSSGRLLWAILAGVSLWGAYMARVEGLVLAIVVALAGFVLPWPGRRISLVVACLATFILLCIPFWIWIRNDTGSWQIAWTQGIGATGVMSWRWDEVLGPGLPSTHFPRIGGFIAFYLKNLATVYHLLPKIFPFFLWFFVAFGVSEVLAAGRNGFRVAVTIIFFASFPLFFYPFFVVEGRLIDPAILLLSMFAGPAVFRLQRYLTKKIGKGRGGGLALSVCLAVLVLNFLLGYRNLLLSFKEEPLEQKRLGIWIKEHSDSPKVILGSDRRSAFYAGPACKRFFSFADARRASENKIPWEDYVRTQGIDLVVADSRYIPSYYPDWRFLLEDVPTGVLAPLISLKEGPHTITLYHVRSFPESLK